MKAIILAGGFGTRLKHILPNTPKPMADINGEPFLQVLIHYLEAQGFDEFVLSIHHMREIIEEHFEGRSNIKFAPEDEPLGTGGAIRNSILHTGLEGDVAVINGDTFLELDYHKLFEAHKGRLTIALRKVEDTSRYGRVEVDGKRVSSFREKGISGKGLINAGSYVINSEWFMEQDLPEKFSFETDFMMKMFPEYFVTEGYFIDIGIPEDYKRAQNELA